MRHPEIKLNQRKVRIILMYTCYSILNLNIDRPLNMVDIYIYPVIAANVVILF